MACYIYTRFSPKNRAYQDQLQQLVTAAPDAVHVEDKVHGFVPPLERSEFSALSARLKSGDRVVIWWLTAFGRDFNQVVSVVNLLLDRGITIQLLCEPLTFEPDSLQTQTLLSLLTGYDKVQTQHRLFAAEQGRQALKDNPELWQQKFRGRPADKEKHERIAIKLLQGHSMARIAEHCQVSLSTVKRVKAKLKQFDDEGRLTRHTNKPWEDGEMK
ncbi:recombinase family protein [Vibrio renipiscarius]|uniref:Recombinase n=1 Tax=Vibrio renipiscarius TaxID=1461322 RepID=A0A0C2NJ75_9VIBR|nr:recombinase family protein [Vibrio renipiscarius]KII76425.1 recombinase [Vibrio renipiscarius]KII78053.1 recombinase [Vibrio renipiscarius]